jgi:microsomal dipeptidase-like Zn-dependent dipeptidase
VHSVEGGHSLLGETSLQHLTSSAWDSLDPGIQAAIETEVLDNLRTLSQRGVAYLTLAHFYPNNLVTPTFPYPEHVALQLVPRAKIDQIREHARLTQGLTPLGRKVVEKMIDYGMLIDVSHATPRARQEIYALVEDSQRQIPLVIATHVGAYEINPTPYNLEDWEIRWISEHGGVIGTIFMTHWLMPHETRFGMNFLSRNIEHFYRIGGENVVAIGTDFDGADPPDDIDDASQLPLLTGRLMGEYRANDQPKYTTQQIQKFMGGNALRVLLTGWGK